MTVQIDLDKQGDMTHVLGCFGIFRSYPLDIYHNRFSSLLWIVMLQLGNHKGWISVDDNELPEYGVQYSEDKKTATCWIPSKVGKVKFPLVILSSSNMALSCTTNVELCDMLEKRWLFV